MKHLNSSWETRRYPRPKRSELTRLARRAAELVGIENHLDYAPHELSGGQKQRVSLAGVMVD